MTNLVVLVACFLLGIALRRSGRLPDGGHRALNAFVINVALPALVLRHVHGLKPDPALLFPAAMPWLLFAMGVLFFAAVGRLAGWPRQTTGGLMLSGGLANTSFVGLPMIETFYGAAFLGVGILVDQLGTYMVLSTVGIVVATVCAASGEAARPGQILRRIAASPPFQALALGLALSPVPYPEAFTAVLDRLGGTVVPVALVSVGSQLRLGEIRECAGELAAGLAFKLVLGPALVTALFVAGLHGGGTTMQVTLFEAAMGPQIGGAIVAMEHGLNPRLVTLMIGVGIPLSLVTAAVWAYLLAGI